MSMIQKLAQGEGSALNLFLTSGREQEAKQMVVALASLLNTQVGLRSRSFARKGAGTNDLHRRYVLFVSLAFQTHFSHSLAYLHTDIIFNVMHHIWISCGIIKLFELNWIELTHLTYWHIYLTQWYILHTGIWPRLKNERRKEHNSLSFFFSRSVPPYVAHWLTDWLIDLLVDWLSDWLTDWLIEWLAPDGLADWLAGWLTDWLTDWITHWPAHFPPPYHTDWLNAHFFPSFVRSQTDNLTDWLAHSLMVTRLFISSFLLLSPWCNCHGWLGVTKSTIDLSPLSVKTHRRLKRTLFNQD